MSRSGKAVLLGVVTVLVVGVGWLAVSWWGGLRSTQAETGPECAVAGVGVAVGDSLALTQVGIAGAALPDSTALTLDAVQLQHGSTINAVGLARGLPDRARVIALATALQESALRNLPDGDRDSLGLFQQRPSQGWGTVAQINDPVYAAGKFYDALVEVSEWATLPLTEAAQAVQYSAFPAAYAKWEAAAQRFATTLSAAEIGLVSCRAGAVAPTADTPPRPVLDGTATATAGLATLLAEAQAELGGLTVTDIADDGRTAGVTAAVGTLDAARSAAALATWAVAHATGSAVTAVEVSARKWVDHTWGPREATPLPAGQVRITVEG